MPFICLSLHEVELLYSDEDEAMCSGSSPTAGRGFFVHGNNNWEDEGGSM